MRFLTGKMNWNRQMEVHYINTGFPYTTTESFMDLFEGLTYAQADFALTGPMHDQQENAYWSIHTSSYKFGSSGPGSTSYYSHNHAYEVNDLISRMDGGMRAWDISSTMYNEEPTPIDMQWGGNANTTTLASPEE
ncbi:hypothetical protein HHK36_017345 [Tetracentron sinense]|uniref:Uncharacterized protein n=1 Tax=Tetracentron sinense TaxID=13715 RepID=A0A835DBU6_TETSI|nr:hypothetical protein HHK36_017345 [Tetracentron sinense]